ncbi:bifunctional phosphatase PAP2/diacylglycerol kinase family protein [Streptomyces himalayensis]|uniref:Phosphatase PAP2 family protein n=1 Tax=Streptomyces himalayensis subsp. himalayensis TaxID=2756131 RepID=A0A7W0DK99_9ACTN|nr:bifunctional phosphatase PAP2/diacylglycerol kinase family protein [Streptomyces himalayensis]MBA2946628.1 phosphatase PAP2 family protein [Streptomyces himalayensis subsp. himalayensis]
MSTDVDLTVPEFQQRHTVLSRLVALDCRLFEAAASRHWPGADPFLPRLSRSANHGLLWFGTAAAIAATRSPRARRAALRGTASLALASATINTVGKRSIRRARPILDVVPLTRQLKRQPITTSFPSGHSASAAAFATGVALESRRWGSAVAPVAAAVALSRVYTGVHFPSDVLAGAALGAGAAFAVRGLVPTRDQLQPAVRPAAEAPALPQGQGLVVVVNTAAGQPDRIRALHDALPLAEVVECEPADIKDELERAARRALALGVCGGDGTVNAAARVALRHGLPLAVVPGGTLNHFAQDIGIEDVRNVCQAVERGEAIAVDVGRFVVRDGVGDETEGSEGSGTDENSGGGEASGTGVGAGISEASGVSEGYFLNTLSLGVYAELVREREQWAPRIGGWAAGVFATVRVLQAHRHPLRAGFAIREQPLWLLFAGNGTYHRTGLAPGRRFDLADGLLDVRLVHGGRRPGPRLLAAALAGPLTRSPFHAAVRLRRLRVSGITEGTPMAYDGELTTIGGELMLDKLPGALITYRPLPRTGL